MQRAGRAGRTREGKCIRLYSEQVYQERFPDQTTPEILRVNLASTVLTLKNLGISDVVNFEYMDSPELKQIEESLKQLFYLGAVDLNGCLTKLGEKLSLFPLDPAYGKVIMLAAHMEELERDRKHKSRHSSGRVLEDVIKMVSILSTENIWTNVSKMDKAG